jgi:hypothetical protein
LFIKTKVVIDGLETVFIDRDKTASKFCSTFVLILQHLPQVMLYSDSIGSKIAFYAEGGLFIVKALRLV